MVVYSLLLCLVNYSVYTIMLSWATHDKCPSWSKILELKPLSQKNKHFTTSTKYFRVMTKNNCIIYCYLVTFFSELQVSLLILPPNKQDINPHIFMCIDLYLYEDGQSSLNAKYREWELKVHYLCVCVYLYT